MSGRVAPRQMLWLAAGFATWGSGLVLLYGLHCQRRSKSRPKGGAKVCHSALGC